MFEPYSKPVYKGSATARFFSRKIQFSSAAVRMLDNASHVVLLFDREGRRVGFQIVEPGTPGAFKVTYQPYLAFVSSNGFPLENGIQYQKVELRREGDVLVADVELR